MPTTRRGFLRSIGSSIGGSIGAVTLSAAMAACVSSGRAQHAVMPRRLMINGNMVIPFESEGALGDDIKRDLRDTGLAALKVSIGGSAGSYDQAMEDLDNYDQGFLDNADIYLPVRSVSDIDAAFSSNRLGIIRSFEAATMFEGKISRIAEFADRGVKVMQLGYNNTSPFGAGVMSNSGPLGLSNLGREAIAAMQASRVLLDLSHAHEQTALEAIDAATQPVALTHTGCDAINPHPRNKSDIALKTVADTGGVVGIYELSYLTPSLEQTPLSALLAHLEHALTVCGEDHVGIGSDALVLEFDTGPESKARWDGVNQARKESGVAAPGEGPMPFVEGLNGPHRMHVIADKLALLGYKAASIDKIMGLNFRRVFAESWLG